MSRNDFTVIRSPGYTRTADVDDRDSSSVIAMIFGEPIKTTTNFAVPLITGDPEVGTDELLGIVRTDSTETASVDGVVEYVSVIPGQSMIRGGISTATNMDTAAEALGLRQDWISMDLTGAAYTFDENEGTDPNVHGFKVVKTDIVAATMDCIFHGLSTEAASLVGQTMD